MCAGAEARVVAASWPHHIDLADGLVHRPRRHNSGRIGAHVTGADFERRAVFDLDRRAARQDDKDFVRFHV